MGIRVPREFASFSPDSPLVDGNPIRKRTSRVKVMKLFFI
jgi:hypothetical protein